MDFKKKKNETLPLLVWELLWIKFGYKTVQYIHTVSNE